jgi:hypothetical protein
VKSVDVAEMLQPAVSVPSPTSKGRVAVTVWSRPLRVAEKLMPPGVEAQPSATRTVWLACAPAPPCLLMVWPVKSCVVEVPAESVSVRVAVYEPPPVYEWLVVGVLNVATLTSPKFHA